MGKLITETGQGSRNRRAKVKRAMDSAGPVKDGSIRVRLDHRTIITLRSLKALDFWRERYPQLRVL